MTLKERILAFTVSQNIPVSRFESNCGLSNGYIAKMTEKMGMDKLVQILSAYPNLSASWLIAGIGDMLVENDKSANQTAQYQNFQNGNFNTNKMCNDAVYTDLINELKKKDEFIERMIKLLEHIVFKGEKIDF